MIRTIRTDFNVYWTAVLDSYDGAPDAKGPNSCIGQGKIAAAAVADLLDKIDLEEDRRSATARDGSTSGSPGQGRP